MKLFGRRSRLIIGTLAVLDLDGAGNDPNVGLDVSDLDMAFSVKKTLKANPNQAEIEVRNLTENHRTMLEGSDALEVELHAGYGDQLSLLYRGQMRAAVTYRDGPDFVTKISSGDKSGVFAGRRLHVPLGEASSAAAALKQLVDDLGKTEVGDGNVSDALTQAGVLTTVFPLGGTLSGNASVLLTSLCRSVGLEWSIQDGVLQFLVASKALDEEAIELGSNSGLIGKVEVSNKGYVKATSLLIPGLRCGGKVTFATETELVGGYRIEKIHYHGDTAGKSWYASIEAKQY